MSSYKNPLGLVLGEAVSSHECTWVHMATSLIGKDFFVCSFGLVLFHCICVVRGQMLQVSLG